MVPADIHLFNNAEQWEIVFEIRPGEPTPAAIAPRPADFGDEDPPWGEEGLESPSSFWPKFEHRFRPAEEAWFADALPAALSAGKTGEEAITLFTEVLAARDDLAAALPPDGQTPQTRKGGQAVLAPMKRLGEAMSAYHHYSRKLGGVLPRGFNEEVTRWWYEGPHEHLNY